jgi:hypothetical protein
MLLEIGSMDSTNTVSIFSDRLKLEASDLCQNTSKNFNKQLSFAAVLPAEVVQ